MEISHPETWHRVSPRSMNTFRRIAVYCASSNDISPMYRDAAAAMGNTLADHNIGLVFGGGSVGLMGTIADVMIERDCEVIGHSAAIYCFRNPAVTGDYNGSHNCIDLLAAGCRSHLGVCRTAGQCSQ